MQIRGRIIQVAEYDSYSENEQILVTVQLQITGEQMTFLVPKHLAKTYTLDRRMTVDIKLDAPERIRRKK